MNKILKLCNQNFSLAICHTIGNHPEIILFSIDEYILGKVMDGAGLMVDNDYVNINEVIQMYEKWSSLSNFSLGALF